MVSAKEIFEKSQTEMHVKEREQLQHLFVEVDKLLELIKSLKAILHLRTSGHLSLDKFKEALRVAKSLIAVLSSFNLPKVKSRVMETTDGGPGVSVTNHDVCFRTAQKIRILSLDYFIAIHLAPGDSAMNDVERTQSYISDAICDGGTLKWQYKTVFFHMTEEKVDKLTPKDITDMELAVMEHNPSEICEEFKNHCNGAPAPGGFLEAFVSKSLEGIFYKDSQYLEAYISRKKPDIVPGFCYYQKLENFLRLHFIKGKKKNLWSMSNVHA